jgi:hypothetical protein
MAAKIAAFNTAGQTDTIGWFTTDGSTLSAGADHDIFSATFTVTAAGDSTITPVIVPGIGGFLDGIGGSFDPSSVTAGTVLNSVAPQWSLSAPASASVNRGASTDVTVSTAVVGGTPGAITLSASNLPSGVTASFSPAAPAAGSSSTLTFTAAAGAATGPATVTISGTDGTTPHSTTINLNVVAPNDFTISASPTSVNFLAGASSTATVTTAIGNGTPGTVTYSATIPAAATGLTATFSPTSGAVPASSTVTLAADGTTTAGTYAVVVSGTDGIYTHSTTITVTVGPKAPDGAQSVNVTGSMDGGFLGLSCPTAVTMPLVRGNTNQTNAPCVVSTNTVWQLSANDAAPSDHVGFMVTGRPVDGTTTFALHDPFHVLSGGHVISPSNPTVVYTYDHDLSNGGQSAIVGAGTNSANVSTVLSQYVAPNDHAGSYGIQVVFSAVSVF